MNFPSRPAVDRPPLRIGRGVLAAVVGFVVIGTVSALWQNPFFVRMTPVGIWELPAAAVMAALGGAYAAIAVPACRTGGAGGILGFVGIACPTCNKILMLIFGGPALLTYFDPIRPLVAAIGIAVLAWALARAARRREDLARSAMPMEPAR